ncbi:MAG: TlpA disulfide reductase family protein [Haliscomenobacter sp.]|uniref:TlpA family protein disulfide reductase n=1 Tax=Haliscomenobacter sp. TaxID=2717303 RepID=UPI0029BC656F|nr:TlpA disulfide reductase family protein [Haliscomenobacter sp.]MDX2068184.1 TlpA disulfide reductase family protein [Haliscomenobacter sp.]
MKKSACILMLICLSGFLNAQVPFSLEDAQMDAYFANPANVPVIKGRLLNCTAGDLDSLSIRYVLVVPNAQRQEMRYANLKKDGTFEIKLDYPLRYQQFFLLLPYSGLEVIAHKGLYVEADLKELRSVYLRYKNSTDSMNMYQKINFSGPDSSLCQLKYWYNKFEPEVKEQFYTLQRAATNYKLPTSENFKLWNQAFDLIAEHQNRFLEKFPSTDAWLLENERLSEYYAHHFVFHWNKPIPKDGSLDAALRHQPLLVSNDGIAYYRYLQMMLSVAHKGDPLKGFEEIPMPPRKADLVKIMGGPEGLFEREEYIEKILTTLQASWCKQLIQEELSNKKKQTDLINKDLKNMPSNTTKTSLGKFVGALPQGANLYSAEEKNIDSLVQRIRALYPNQAIILDVWATWCAPCISDMKNSKDTKEQLKKLPVKVVYLCVTNNSDEEKWKKKVAELGVDGDHIWLTGDLSARIMERYGLSGYPSYIFIDAKGTYYPKFINSIERLDFDALKKKL